MIEKVYLVLLTLGTVAAGLMLVIGMTLCATGLAEHCS